MKFLTSFRKFCFLGVQFPRQGGDKLFITAKTDLEFKWKWIKMALILQKIQNWQNFLALLFNDLLTIQRRSLGQTNFCLLS